jgi:hypothetical protein
LNFFQIFYHFLLFFGKLKRRSGGGVVAGEFFWKLTRSAWGMWCATGKFSNFENFAADSKMFEKISADSKKLAGNLPVAHHICIPVAHSTVLYG